MEETTEPITDLSSGAAAEAVEPLSATDTFIGILTEPGPTYDVIGRTAPRTAYWLLPTLVCCLILGAGLVYRFSTPQMKEQMVQQTREKLQEQVKAGKMSAEDAEQGVAQFEKIFGIIAFTAPVSGAIGMFLFFLLFALIVWLLVRYVFKLPVRYGLVLAVIGPTFYIVGIDQLLSLLLGLLTENPFANFSPALLMNGTIKDMPYRAAMQCDPIAIWSYYVMGIGLHRGCGISKVQGFGTAFGLWGIMVALAIFAGFGV
jgi:hypothetical protein